MKNLILLSVAFLFAFASSINAKVSSEALDYNSNCNWQSWFEYPNKSYFNAGEDVYVRVKPKYKQHIKSMTLYVGNTMIRTESSYPYEWCKNNSSGDNYLRHLQPGTYKLKVKIIDHCHKTNYIYKTITVKGGGNGGNNDNCHFNNPCNDLHWLKQLKQQHSNWSICEYRKNGKIYFKLFQCGVSHYTTYWYDCHGNLICKGQNGQDCFSGCAYVKCWYSPCDNGNNNNHCDYKTWFEYPKQSHFSKGSDVYVRVTPSKKYDIAYMKLYLDGHFVRQETSYPFEWCKNNSGGDYALRNMQHKGQHNIKVEIKDKCGQKHYQHYKFYIN